MKKTIFINRLSCIRRIQKFKNNSHLKICFMVIAIFMTTSSLSQGTLGLHRSSIGIGMGMDYGGIGVNISHYITPRFGYFIGFGYVAPIGFNIGVKARLFKDDRTHGVFPVFMAMYGYNAAIVVKNETSYNKTFYGATLGFGLEIKPRPQSKGTWNFAFLVPFRSTEVEDYMHDLERNHGVVFERSLPDVGLSLGYRWMISSFRAGK